MTTTPTTVTFIGAKGGVGTSTVAAMYALTVARRSDRLVRLTASHDAGVEDLAALLAVPTPGHQGVVEAGPGLTLADHVDANYINVVDGGTSRFSDDQGAVYVVLRNDYLSLRRALDVPRTTLGAILLSEPKRSLGRRDVEDVLSYPVVAEIHVEPAIARLVDAGLLATARTLRIDLDVNAQSEPAL